MKIIKIKHFDKLLIVTLFLVYYLILQQYPRKAPIYEQAFIQVLATMVLFCLTILVGRWLSEKIENYQKYHQGDRASYYAYIKSHFRKIFTKRFSSRNVFKKSGHNNPDIKINPPNQAQDTQANPLNPGHRGILKESSIGVNEGK